MEIKTLKTFIKAAKLKNFSAAAKALNTGQPTISRHISELESELGVKLFTRTTHQVELTKAGEVLLPEALDILANDKRVKQLVGQCGQVQESVINVGYLATACSFFLPPLIGSYTKQSPHVVTNLYEMTAEEQYTALLENKIDIAFSRYQSRFDNDAFQAEQLYSDKVVAVLPVSHPLANQLEISIDDILSEKFILFHKTSWVDLYEHIISLFKDKDVVPNIVRHPDNMRHLATSVSSGLGISIAPKCIQFITDNNCVCIPIVESKMKWPLYVYARKTAINKPLNDLIQTCLDHADDIQDKVS